MSQKLRTLSMVVMLGVVHCASYGKSQDPSAKTCKTPKDESGICVLLDQCPTLKNLILPGVLSDENLYYLQNSTCKAMEFPTTYCCPASEVAVPPPPPPPSLKRSGVSDAAVDAEVNEEPVDVSTSPRLDMLPLKVCGPNADGRIVKGNMSDVGQFPWMALLGYQTASSQLNPFCGGSLINNRYVLTAAHCVAERNSWRSLVVRLGELHTFNETDCTGLGPSKVCAPPIEEYTVEDVIIHPKFNKPSRHLNDIALLRLNQTVIFQVHITPICLPIGNEQTGNLLEDKPKLSVAGWGITENGTSSAHLLFGYVPVVSQEKCSESYSEIRSQISASRQLCAGGLESDSCYGDSGGPLSFFGEVEGTPQIVQYGIVSFGPSGCAIKDKPAVYTRVGFYMDWILNTLKP